MRPMARGDLVTAEQALVDGALIHPELLPQIVTVVDPADITDSTCRGVFRALIAAHDAGLIEPGVLGAGYVAAGRQIEAEGRWSAEVFRPGAGGVDTSDPVAAAHVVAEAARRRELAHDLAAAAEAIALGADPEAVLARLELAA